MCPEISRMLKNETRMRTFAVMALSISISVLISAFLFMAIIRGISLPTPRAPYRILTAEQMTVTSNVPESPEYSIAKGNQAEKLIDGSSETMAAPAARDIDYAIRLLEPHEMKQIEIEWGSNGLGEEYIASWSLEASMDGKTWATIETGGFPGERETVITRKTTASFLRLKAHSEKNWIGAYEIKIIARPAS